MYMGNNKRVGGTVKGQSSSIYIPQMMQKQLSYRIIELHFD